MERQTQILFLFFVKIKGEGEGGLEILPIDVFKNI